MLMDFPSLDILELERDAAENAQTTNVRGLLWPGAGEIGAPIIMASRPAARSPDCGA